MEHASLVNLDPLLIAAMVAVMLLGGFVKGAVGFALPMITISGVGSFLSAQETVAILILPTFLSNTWQTLRQGRLAAMDTLRRFWKLNLTMGVTIVLVAQVVPDIPSEVLFAFLGVMVSGAAALQLAGWQPVAREGQGWIEVGTGIIAGIAGGLSGVWGPPVIFFLVALGVPKTEQVRAQGMAFLVGSILLVGAHLKSGLLDEVTIPWSAAMCLPVVVGMLIGLAVQDRMDQRKFRRFTLAVLCVAGLNLLRRAFF